MDIKCPNCDTYVQGPCSFDRKASEYVLVCPICQYRQVIHRLPSRKRKGGAR